jgi:hypothetical protein
MAYKICSKCEAEQRKNVNEKSGLCQRPSTASICLHMYVHFTHSQVAYVGTVANRETLLIMCVSYLHTFSYFCSVYLGANTFGTHTTKKCY